ncbi:hypothetical protein [Methylibium petroleiphilum]
MKQQQGSLRDVMPETAGIVDWLRTALGKERADRIVINGKAGRGGFYMAEIGPDGVFREFGSTKSGRRLSVVDGKMVWSDEKGGRRGA